MNNDYEPKHDQGKNKLGLMMSDFTRALGLINTANQIG